MQEFNRKKLILIIIAVFLVFGLLGFFVFKGFFQKPPTKEQEIEKIEKTTQQSLDADLGKEFGKDYEVKNINFYDNGNWAVAHLVPKTFETDEAMVVYKKEEKEWKIFLGPGTFFNDADPALLNQLPSEVKKEIGVEE